jgi:hypothetical protein
VEHDLHLRLRVQASKDPTPLHMVEKPAPGTGATVDAISIIAGIVRGKPAGLSPTTPGIQPGIADEQRPAEPHLTLAVTRDGMPVRSSVLPGDTADVTTVERIKEDLPWQATIWLSTRRFWCHAAGRSL